MTRQNRGNIQRQAIGEPGITTLTQSHHRIHRRLIPTQPHGNGNLAHKLIAPNST
jgi:hypothetical protein